MNPFLALYEHSEFLRRTGRIDRYPGFREVELFVLIRLDLAGTLLGLEYLGQPRSDGVRGDQGLTVSAPFLDRSSNTLPRPLFDDVRYVLSPGKKRDAFYETTIGIRDRLAAWGRTQAAERIEAIRLFGTRVDDTDALARFDAMVGLARRGRPKTFEPQISFSVSDDESVCEPIIVDEDVRSAILPRHFDPNPRIATCTLTGEHTEVARLHDMIHGRAFTIAGARPTGAVLSSFNTPNTWSYGCSGDDRFLNAPMKREIVESYPDGLKYLGSYDQRKHWIASENRAVIMFITRDDEDDALTRLRDAVMGYAEPDAVFAAREQLARLVGPETLLRDAADQTVLAALSSHPHNAGTPQAIAVEGDINVLTITPQEARLAITGFERMPIVTAYRRVLDWFEAGSITAPKGSRIPAATIGHYLNALQGKVPECQAINPWSEGKRDIVAQDLFLSATTGAAIGDDILLATLHAFSRTLRGVEALLARKVPSPALAQFGVLRVQHRLASLAKLCLTYGPPHQRRPMTIDLDHTNDDPAYLAGRIFATMVYAQEKALPDANMRFKMMTAAAQRSPNIILTRLNPKSEAHRDKLNKEPQRLRNMGAPERDIVLATVIARRADAAYREAFAMMRGPWPTVLSPAQQAVFLCAYNQQTLDFYRRTPRSPEDVDAGETQAPAEAA